ncbi:retrovirus-related pol polyprotein from transposon TNT 1-94 [Tanacetum coccineum]
MKVKESLNVIFDKSPSPTKLSSLVDDDVGEEETIIKNTKVVNNNNEEDESIEVDEIVNIKESKNYPLDQGLVPLPISQSVIGTKWVFRNKLDENGIISRNKARLVAQGYNQQEGIDYDETYAPVARFGSIRILLAIAGANDFKLYQMDVKSAFLNGFINKEVYVAQPLGFIDFQKPNYVYKLKKALFGLNQAPKAWYDRLKSFLIKHEYSMGMVDNTLFTKKSKSHLIIVQIYVDDIIFGSTSQNLCDDFAKIMHDEFKMKYYKTQYYYVCSCSLLLDPLKDWWIDSLQELSTLGTSLKKPLSKGIVHHSRSLNDLKTSTTSSRKAMNRYIKLGNGPIPEMKPTQALMAIQTMAEHSQKWHEGTSSSNISSSSDTDELAAVISKLDNLGHDIKKLKENVHSIQVGCQICKGPHLTKNVLSTRKSNRWMRSSMVNLGAPSLSTENEYDDNEEFEDPDGCEESKENKILLHDELFKGIDEDDDDLEGITDYLEPTLYDGFVDSDDEEYKERKCRLLGMPYIKPPPILIEKVNVTRYSIGLGKVYTKIKVSGVEELSRTRGNIATIRARIMDEISRNDDNEESYDET